MHYRNKDLSISSDIYNQLLFETEEAMVDKICRNLIFTIIENNMYKLTDLCNIIRLKYMIKYQLIDEKDLIDIVKILC